METFTETFVRSGKLTTHLPILKLAEKVGTLLQIDTSHFKDLGNTIPFPGNHGQTVLNQKTLIKEHNYTRYTQPYTKITPT